MTKNSCNTCHSCHGSPFNSLLSV
ncbi:cytochrome c3 family protein [Chamaesiphon sp.]